VRAGVWDGDVSADSGRHAGGPVRARSGLPDTRRGVEAVAGAGLRQGCRVALARDLCETAYASYPVEAEDGFERALAESREE